MYSYNMAPFGTVSLPTIDRILKDNFIYQNWSCSYKFIFMSVGTPEKMDPELCNKMLWLHPSQTSQFTQSTLNPSTPTGQAQQAQVSVTPPAKPCNSSDPHSIEWFLWVSVRQGRPFSHEKQQLSYAQLSEVYLLRNWKTCSSFFGFFLGVLAQGFFGVFAGKPRDLRVQTHPKRKPVLQGFLKCVLSETRYVAAGGAIFKPDPPNLQKPCQVTSFHPFFLDPCNIPNLSLSSWIQMLVVIASSVYSSACCGKLWGQVDAQDPPSREASQITDRDGAGFASPSRFGKVG